MLTEDAITVARVKGEIEKKGTSDGPPLGQVSCFLSLSVVTLNVKSPVILSLRSYGICTVFFI